MRVTRGVEIRAKSPEPGAERPQRNGARRRSRFGSVDLAEIQAELLRPFGADAVDFMVQATVGGSDGRPERALVVPYLQKVAVTAPQRLEDSKPADGRPGRPVALSHSSDDDIPF
jgi:hypothetical protein